MKKRFFLFLFLGTVATSFAQRETKAMYQGRATVSYPTEGVIRIFCGSGERVCFFIDPIMGYPDRFRLMIPDYGFDKIVSPASTIDGVPFDQLPIDNEKPLNEGNINMKYEIKLEEF